MAQNSSTNPATEGNTSINGSAGNDQLSGGGGSDTILGLAGADRLSGDAPLAGQWRYSVYDRQFSNASNQTSLIGDSQSTLIGRGYVDDFNAEDLRNTLGGTATGSTRDDFGIIYDSGLQITAGGRYTFSTRSDDGSRIIIRNADGVVVFNLDNDRDQGATTRSDSVVLPQGLYTIEVRYWENAGVTAMSGTISGPGNNAPIVDLATSPLITAPLLTTQHVDGDDSILGGTGNDTITGGGGNDRLFGGDDQDSILGETGRDSIDGGTGNDFLDGGTENDTIDGGAGRDTILGGAGADSIFGNDGDDSIDGGSDNDTIDGGIGNDTVFSDSVGSGTDSIFGGDGDDSLMFGDGDDSVFGGAGNDVIDDRDAINLTGTNLLYGGGGNDTVWAGFGADSIFGDAGNDQLAGEGGNDSIYGGSGVDTLDGAGGNDRFIYLAGDVETLAGGGPAEFIFGGGGDPNNNLIDFDTVDVTGLVGEFGWRRVIIQRSGDPENGQIDILDAPNGNVIATIFFDDIEAIIKCFTPGTMILTDRGEVAVELLVVGDLVMTHDHGLQPVRWVGRQHLSRARLVAQPELQPVRIAKGSVAGGGPDRSMLVSPQHRILVTGARAELLFGEPEVLVPAKHLIGNAEVTRALPDEGVTYIHILFDQHQILRSDGIWSESFQLAARNLSAMEAAVRDEILAIFPELRADDPASQASRPTIRAHEAMVLFAG